jgi:hypothetical protein
MNDDNYTTPMEDLPNLVRLSDKQKAAIAPEMAHRAGILYGLVRFRMIRKPVTDEEQKVWAALLETFPTYSDSAD